jgi:hypothetical protein
MLYLKNPTLPTAPSRTSTKFHFTQMAIINPNLSEKKYLLPLDLPPLLTPSISQDIIADSVDIPKSN